MSDDRFSFFFFFNDTATTEIYTLSLHDALPISSTPSASATGPGAAWPSTACRPAWPCSRSEEHTSELQSRQYLVCRLLLDQTADAAVASRRRCHRRRFRHDPRRLLDPFFFNDTPTTEIYALSLHDALPIRPCRVPSRPRRAWPPAPSAARSRSARPDRKSTRLNSSHANISYAVFCLKKKKINKERCKRTKKKKSKK